jgi:hypothetical protein
LAEFQWLVLVNTNNEPSGTLKGEEFVDQVRLSDAKGGKSCLQSVYEIAGFCLRGRFPKLIIL